MDYSQLDAPHDMTPEDRRLGWLREIVRDGETVIRNSPSFEDFQKGKNIIAGIEENKISQNLSRINVNLQKRLIRDIVATMSNLRPLWGYSTDNRELDKQSEILNKLLLSWYQTSFVDRGIKKGLQYAAAMGTGWIGPDWKKDFWTRGRGEIAINAYSPENVLPYQLPADNDIQRAYAVTIKEETPINLARAMFPTMAGKIIADRSAPSGLKKGIGKMASFLSPVLNRFAADQKSRKAIDSVFPVVDIYQTYILDLSVNEGPSPRVMGEPGTYWNYTVPVLGSDMTDPTTGRTRKATPEDAMLYPFRRLVTWCNSGILRDGPSYWWHGMVPLVPIYFDVWAWEFLGYSMTRDLNPLSQSNNALRRSIDDNAQARMRPALMYDDRTLSQGLVSSLDTRVPGQAIGVDFTLAQRPMMPVLDASYYDVPQWIPNFLQSNEEMMKYLSGVVDFTAIAKAAQLPSSDTIEKMFEAAGPMVQDISRSMEASLGKLGEMVKGMFFEFYTSTRRLQILGPDGITSEDTDYYEPGTMFPDHMPWEEKSIPSTYSMVERARHYMDSFFFKITPNSLHNITQFSRKLLYIQLQKAGVPIDPWTMAEICDIPNFGRPPQAALSVMDRWVAFERLKGELGAEVQAQAAQVMGREQLLQQLQAQGIAQQMQQEQLQGALQGGPPPSGGEIGPGGPPAGGGAPPLPQKSPSPALGQQGEGRPPQFAGSPTIQSKDGGTRSTITSK